LSRKISTMPKKTTSVLHPRLRAVIGFPFLRRTGSVAALPVL
jgi:hypothetical protein